MAVGRGVHSEGYFVYSTHDWLWWWMGGCYKFLGRVVSFLHLKRDR